MLHDVRRQLLSGWKASQILSDLVANASEYGEPLLLGTLQSGGVFKVVVDGNRLAREDRAAFLCVVADGQDVVELLPGEFIDALGALAGNVDVQLAHGGNGLGPHMAWLGTGAERLETVARVVPQETFGHLAPG